jgi:hypothetical protein
VQNDKNASGFSSRYLAEHFEILIIIGAALGLFLGFGVWALNKHLTEIKIATCCQSMQGFVQKNHYLAEELYTFSHGSKVERSARMVRVWRLAIAPPLSSPDFQDLRQSIKANTLAELNELSVEESELVALDSELARLTPNVNPRQEFILAELRRSRPKMEAIFQAANDVVIARAATFGLDEKDLVGPLR